MLTVHPQLSLCGSTTRCRKRIGRVLRIHFYTNFFESIWSQDRGLSYMSEEPLSQTKHLAVALMARPRTHYPPSFLARIRFRWRQCRRQELNIYNAATQSAAIKRKSIYNMTQKMIRSANLAKVFRAKLVIHRYIFEAKGLR